MVTQADLNQEPPRIEFPCDYPIKIMGHSHHELHEIVVQTINEHAPGFNRNLTTIRHSEKGNYQSITVTITATGTPQLQAIFEDLKKSPLIKMVL